MLSARVMCACVYSSQLRTLKGLKKKLKVFCFEGRILRMWVIVVAGGWESCSIYFCERTDRVAPHCCCWRETGMGNLMTA